MIADLERELPQEPNRRAQVLRAFVDRDDVCEFLPVGVRPSRETDVMQGLLSSVRESLAELAVQQGGRRTGPDDVAHRSVLTAVCHPEQYKSSRAAREIIGINKPNWSGGTSRWKARLAEGAPFAGKMERARRRYVSGAVARFV